MKIKLAIIGAAFFWFSFFSVTILSSMPYSPVSPSKDVNTFVTSHVLQSWGFFSKDPRDPYFNVYTLDDDNESLLWPNHLPSNLFGLNRQARAQGIEAGTLYRQVDTEKIVSCDTNPVDCFKDMPVAQEITNKTKNPTLCGEIGLALEEPIPWAWGKSDHMEAPSELIKVEVSCEHG